jgi:hypothetical protein
MRFRNVKGGPYYLDISENGFWNYMCPRPMEMDIYVYCKDSINYTNNATSVIDWQLLRAYTLAQFRLSERRQWGEKRVWYAASLYGIRYKRDQEAICELKKLAGWSRLTQEELVWAMLDSTRGSREKRLLI